MPGSGGLAAEGCGRYDEATDHALAALDIASAHGDVMGQAHSIDALASIGRATGRYEEATQSLEATLQAHRPYFRAELVARLLNTLGESYLAAGSPLLAEERYVEARRYAERAGSRLQVSRALLGLGDTHAALGDRAGRRVLAAGPDQLRGHAAPGSRADQRPSAPGTVARGLPGRTEGGVRMVTVAAVVGVAVIALGMVLTPGPNMMYLVSRSISQGRSAGLVSLAGVVVGFTAYVGATAAGLAYLFAAVPGLFLAVKVAGAAYLLYLAWGILRGGRRAFGAGNLPPHSRPRLFVMGLTTCLLNPKIALMYAALLPQFVDPSRGSVALQLMLLGMVQIVVATTGNACWVLLASSMKAVLERSRVAERITRWVTGTLLAGFAIHLGVSQPARA